MRYLAFVLALMGVASAASAQDAIPDLKGTWEGKGTSIVFGNNGHHPGAQTVTSPPRVSPFDFTFVIEGQDGHLAWGHSFSSMVSTHDPVAWAISADNKMIFGANHHGYFHLTVVSPDRMEMCYNHAGLDPTGSIVATCFMLDRKTK